MEAAQNIAKAIDAFIKTATTATAAAIITSAVVFLIAATATAAAMAGTKAGKNRAKHKQR